MWTIVKDFIEFVTILLLFYVLVFWLWGRWVGILAPAWPGNEPRVPALEGKVLTTGLPGKSSGSSKKTKKGFLHSVLKEFWLLQMEDLKSGRFLKSGKFFNFVSSYLYFCICFRISLSISIQSPVGIFTGIALNLWICLWELTF